MVESATDGTPCPPVRLLIDKERCSEAFCFTYQWQTGAWGQCQLSEPHCPIGSQCAASLVDSPRCGVGARRRDVYCQKNNQEKQPFKKYELNFTIKVCCDNNNNIIFA